jgi:threonine dehydrogenase-like Zn-dependent dehydrogenase
MHEVVEVLARRGLHPESLVTSTSSLDDAPAAYEQFAAGGAGKYVLVP